MLDTERHLTWRTLQTPEEQQQFWEQIWDDVVALRARYRLAVRAAWFEDEIQVEALAALALWVQRYDSGEWDDPPGKLTLLFEFERVDALLRDGNDPFHPNRDRPAFDQHVRALLLAHAAASSESPEDDRS